MIGPCEVLTPEGPVPLSLSVSRAIAPREPVPAHEPDTPPRVDLDPHDVAPRARGEKQCFHVLGVPVFAGTRILLADGTWRTGGDIGPATVLRTWSAEDGRPGEAPAGASPTRGKAEVVELGGAALVRASDGGPWIAVGGGR